MHGWMLLWKIVFIAGITLFACVAIWVAIAGARDIRKLFMKLNRKHGVGS